MSKICRRERESSDGPDGTGGSDDPANSSPDFLGDESGGNGLGGEGEGAGAGGREKVERGFGGGGGGGKLEYPPHDKSFWSLIGVRFLGSRGIVYSVGVDIDHTSTFIQNSYSSL